MQIFACPGNETLAQRLVSGLDAKPGALTWHRFPDGETLVRVQAPPQAEVGILCTLADPDSRVLPLLLTADALRAQGAARVGLIAPYLAYMRQDKSFHPGEAVSAHHFGALLRQHFDWLVAVDPHLHRLRDLRDIFPGPQRAVHATLPVAQWIKANVTAPVLVGPDGESAQWVAAVAAETGAPWFNFTKHRLGDRQVQLEMPQAGANHRGRQAVLVDDIISTGETLAAAARTLRSAGFAAPWCVAVHGLFAGAARDILADAGIARVTVTDSVPQPESAIGVAPLLASSVSELLGGSSP